MPPSKSTPKDKRSHHGRLSHNTGPALVLAVLESDGDDEWWDTRQLGTVTESKAVRSDVSGARMQLKAAGKGTIVHAQVGRYRHFYRVVRK